MSAAKQETRSLLDQSTEVASASLLSPSSTSLPRPSKSRPTSPPTPNSHSRSPSNPRLRTQSNSLRRGSKNTITASAAAASVERIPRTSSSGSVSQDYSSRPSYNSLRKHSSQSRIGRDFEVLLASDETFVLKPPADQLQTSSTPSSPASESRTRSQRIGSIDALAPRSTPFGSTSPLPSAQSRRFDASQPAPASPDRSTSLPHHNQQAARNQAIASAAHRYNKAMPDAPTSVSLAEEVEASTPSKYLGVNASHSSTTFRQRMKKTSGFLRKLRGDAGSLESRDPAASSSKLSLFSGSARDASGSASGVGSSQQTVAAQSAKASLGSPRRVSIASNATSNASNTATKFQPDSTGDPTVPSSGGAADTSTPLDARTRGRHLEITPSQPPQRVPSTPVTRSERANDLSLPPRSTSQGHIRPTSARRDSNGMSTSIRSFETEVTDALDKSPRDFGSPSGFKPNPKFDQGWGRGPQLPDLDIQRYKQRNGSFLEEPDFGPTNDRKQSAPATIDTGLIPRYPISSMTGTSLSAGKPDSAATQSKNGFVLDEVTGQTVNRRDKLSSADNGTSPPGKLSRRESATLLNTPKISTDSIRSSAMQRKNTASGASMTSIKSFETAAESAGLNSVDSDLVTYPYGPGSDFDKTETGGDETTDAPWNDEGDDTVRNMQDDAETETHGISDVHGSDLRNTSATDVPSIAVLNVSPHTTTIAKFTNGAEGGTAMSASPSSSAHDLAARCWNEDPSFLKKEKIAEWLGGFGPINHSARAFYFLNFDFAGLRVDDAFRRLCEKLFLRAETLQIDRILSAFSKRYIECNPDSVFGNADVVHSVVFSILLLNTDLHIAELQERMTRQQFVRNTMGAIAESNIDNMGDADDARSSYSVGVTSLDVGSTRSLALPRTSTSSRGDRSAHTQTADTPGGSSRPSMALSTRGTHAELEQTLKDIYAAVKTDRILLPTPADSDAVETITGRTPGTFGGNRRVMTTATDRITALRRGSIRGIQGLLGGAEAGGLGSSASSSNLLRTSTDVRGRSSASLTPVLELAPAPTPGFASTLSQTIIKETQNEDGAPLTTANKRQNSIDENDDNLLALSGPPWAKEGSLTRKFYWESAGKRAKDKNWTEVFVVISKGTLSMFRFDLNSSTATKSRAAGPDAVMGGGNWLSSATCLGEFSLAHSLANALPPPGYNRARPHVFALTLASGSVYFFQTGHEELIQEWVSTCNYWAGRTSKQPLAGGVSNMEYGWNKVLPPMDDFDDKGNDAGPPDASIYQGTTLLGQPETKKRTMDSKSVKSHKSSAQQSLRSKMYHGFSMPNSNSSSASVMGHASTNESVFVNDWRVPTLPTVPSTLSEEKQLARLTQQVALIEKDLALHASLLTPMQSLYTPGGTNSIKSLTNWERKSNYLLQELVKYQTYAEALRRSTDLKAERRSKRDLQDMIEESDDARSHVHLSQQ